MGTFNDVVLSGMAGGEDSSCHLRVGAEQDGLGAERGGVVVHLHQHVEGHDRLPRARISFESWSVFYDRGRCR